MLHVGKISIVQDAQPQALISCSAGARTPDTKPDRLQRISEEICRDPHTGAVEIQDIGQSCERTRRRPWAQASRNTAFKLGSLLVHPQLPSGASVPHRYRAGICRPAVEIDSTVCELSIAVGQNADSAAFEVSADAGGAGVHIDE